jgi:CRP/FNR family transcriptional regulator, anaerobic regulatory protein
MSTTIACAECPVREPAICAALESAERDRLAAVGRQAVFRRGEPILSGNDDAIACATLVSGAAKVSTFDSEGVERIVALVHPAGFIGQMFGIAPNQHVTALTDSRLCLFPRRPFEAALADHPALMRRLLDVMLSEVDAGRAIIDMIGRRQAIVRVAALLLAFARAAGPTPCSLADDYALALTRGEMAQLLGLTIETVSRNLVALERRGLIRRKGVSGLEILDMARLEQLVA